MDAEKRKVRIGHGVNQMAHQKLAILADAEVLAAKRHDANLARTASQGRDAVRVQTRAGNQARGRIIGSVRLDAPGVPFATKSADSRIRHHFSALRANLFSQNAAHGGIIGDAFLGNTDGGDTRGMRLDLA